MSYLLDTNILIRLANPSDVDSIMVRSVVEGLIEQGESLCFAAQNLVEFWNVCTRPIGKNGLGLSVAGTDAKATIVEARFRFLPDSVSVHSQWRRLVVQHSVSGIQVHDAKLAAFMMVHSVPKILTLNDRDFRRYTGIYAFHPRDLPR